MLSTEDFNSGDFSLFTLRLGKNSIKLKVISDFRTLYDFACDVWAVEDNMMSFSFHVIMIDFLVMLMFVTEVHVEN